jgi:hypothetical protein
LKGGEKIMAEKKQMPVGGSFTYGQATGKPASTSTVKTGQDLRDGK